MSNPARKRAHKVAALAALPGVTLPPAGWMLRTATALTRDQWPLRRWELHYLAMAATCRRLALYASPTKRRQLRGQFGEWLRGARQARDQRRAVAAFQETGLILDLTAREA